MPSPFAPLAWDSVLAAQQAVTIKPGVYYTAQEQPLTCPRATWGQREV